MLILRKNYQKKIQETDQESEKKNAKHRGTQQLMRLTKTTLFEGKTHKLLFFKLITPRSHVTEEITSFQLKQELHNLDEKRKINTRLSEVVHHPFYTEVSGNFPKTLLTTITNLATSANYLHIAPTLNAICTMAHNSLSIAF